MKLLPGLDQLQKTTILISAVIIVGVTLWFITKYIIKRRSFVKEFIYILENKSDTLNSFFSHVRLSGKNIKNKAQLIVKSLNQKQPELAKKIIIYSFLPHFLIAGVAIMVPLLFAPLLLGGAMAAVLFGQIFL